jgi:hypothetical protein
MSLAAQTAERVALYGSVASKGDPIPIHVDKATIPDKWRQHLLNACPAVPTSTQRLSCHTYIYSTPVPPYLHLFNACLALLKKKAGMFSDS